MEKELRKFYQNIKKIKEGVYEYEDEKGNYSLLDDKRYLAVIVSYLELDEIELKQAIFQRNVDKSLTYNKIKVTRPVDKSFVTHKEKDKGTLVDKEIEVNQVWICSNGLGCRSSFTTKEEAINFAKDINDRFYDTID